VQKKDKYGRTLAYAYITTNIPTGTLLELAGDDFNFYVDGEQFVEIFVNATIVNAGYAQILTIPPNVKYQELFLRLEREARESKRGLWK